MTTGADSKEDRESGVGSKIEEEKGQVTINFFVTRVTLSQE